MTLEAQGPTCQEEEVIAYGQLLSRGYRICVVALLAIGAAVAPARSDLIAIEASSDNTLYEDAAGGLSNGTGTAMFAGRNSGMTNSIRRAVLAFDVANAIPAGSIIESATLTLTNSAANAEVVAVGLHRLLADWGEGTSVAGGAGGGGSGAPAAPGDATWTHTFYDSQFWTTPGGDFDALISAAAPVGGPGTYLWTSTEQLVADVQQFLDEPASNFGWMLLGDESLPSTAKRFATREDADAGVHPVLTVSYTTVPEPDAITLLMFLFLSAIARRRCNRIETTNEPH